MSDLAQRLSGWAMVLDSRPEAKELSGLRGDLREQAREMEKLRELCLDAYAVIDVLANGVGKISTPDGFFDLWNRTGIGLEQVGGKPFKKRMAVLASHNREGSK